MTLANNKTYFNILRRTHSCNFIAVMDFSKMANSTTKSFIHFLIEQLNKSLGKKFCITHTINAMTTSLRVVKTLLKFDKAHVTISFSTFTFVSCIDRIL